MEEQLTNAWCNIPAELRLITVYHIFRDQCKSYLLKEMLIENKKRARDYSFIDDVINRVREEIMISESESN